LLYLSGMATYKLIQDIEAEDHILGPLTLRQFIFALIAVFLFYICFFLFTKHIYVIIPVFLLPALFFGFFALPLGRDQPTEIWALAKLRYWFKPRQRIWNQSGVKELVTINVPKKIEHIFTDGLSQVEVKSRLQALANTIDTRGWATKNVNIGTYGAMTQSGTSDRLIDIDSIPQAVPDNDIMASDDILDEQSNPIAQQFSSMIDKSSQDHRQRLMDKMNEVRQDRAQETSQSSKPKADYWFMGTPMAPGSAPAAPIPAPQAAQDDDALSAQLKTLSSAQEVSINHMRTIQPVGAQPAAAATVPVPATGVAPVVTPTGDPAIISLASNDDLNVATLAREAKKAKGDDEVVISLH